MRFATARIQGNLGDWIELVVLEDHLDIRGWELRWAETDLHDTDGTDIWYGSTTVEQGIITFSETATIWSDLHKGTVITVAEKHDIEVDTDWDASYPPNRNFTYNVADEDAEVIIELRSDTSYDPENGDWWIHVDTKDEAEQIDPVVTTVSNVSGHTPGEGNFSVGNGQLGSALWSMTVASRTSAPSVKRRRTGAVPASTRGNSGSWRPIPWIPSSSTS